MAEQDEQLSDYVLRLLVAAGHVTQAKVDEAVEIARKTPGVVQGSETGEAVAEVGDLVLDVRKRVEAAGAKNQDKLYLRAANDQRDAALREAALICDKAAFDLGSYEVNASIGCNQCAKRIRAAIESDRTVSPETTMTNPNARPPAPPIDPSLRQAVERDILDQKVREAAEPEQPKTAPPSAPTKESS